MAFSFGQAASQQQQQQTPQWYYYLSRDPHGRPDNWYRYEMSIENTIEAFYQAHRAAVAASSNKKARQLLPMTASSGYQYEVDFQAMTQQNTTSRKSRPIGRTTDGRPPQAGSNGHSQQQPAFAAPVAAAVIPAFGSGSAAQPAPSFAFGSSAPTAPPRMNPSYHQPSAPPAPSAPQQPAPAFAFGQPFQPAIAAVSQGFRFGSSAPAAAAPSRRPGVHATRQAIGGGGYEISYTAPDNLHDEVLLDESKIFQDVAPPSGKPPAAAGDNGGDEKKQADNTSSYANASHDDECVICIENLWKPHADDGKKRRVVAIKTCGHRFHSECIHEALTKGGPKCPLCSKSVEQKEGVSKTSKGKGPSGTMRYVTDSRDCSGYAGAGTIRIDYAMPSGIQESYHTNPGQPFSGAHRTAYLPANTEGWDTLARMQYAFAHGLMFMVGISLTSGRANQTTWASIHNKTSYSGGTYGFPDATYFTRVNGEMDGLDIPAADACRTWLQQL